MYGAETKASKKMIARIAEAQNTMCHAISRGNINQIGWNAWSSMVDLIQEMVLDHMNDAKTKCDDRETDDLNGEISEKLDEMRKYREGKFYTTETEQQIRNMHEDYNELATDLENCKLDFDNRVHKNTFPQFINSSVPNDMYSVTYNNSWDLCYGYMTTCIKAKDMEKWYETAAECKDNPKIKIDHKIRRDAKEAICSLSDCYDHPSYYTCSSKLGHTCPLPNTKKTPDVVVAIVPEDNKKYLKIPVFVFEVIGSKDIRGTNERQFPGFVATLQCLAFSPYAYYGEVDDETVTLYHFRKLPDEGRIKITKKDFRYADNDIGAMSTAFGDIVEALTDIFVDIYLNLSWVNHETSRLMKQAEYTDFVATTDGRHDTCIEMHCWHLFKPKIFASDNYESPEYTAYDKCDPSIPEDEKETPVNDDIYKLVGDELVPVVSSDAKTCEIMASRICVDEKSCCKSLKPDTSRAVRDPSNGMPTNPLVESHWDTAYNQFHSNISKYIQNTGHSVYTQGVQSEILNHEDFDRYFNPRRPHQ